MPAETQARKHSLRRAIKRKLIDRDMTARSLAAQVGHDLAVVSKAINHGKFPRVRAKILEVLA
jgi:DNA-binding Xre family transcriptional regulator